MRYLGVLSGQPLLRLFAYCSQDARTRAYPARHVRWSVVSSDAPMVRRPTKPRLEMPRSHCSLHGKHEAQSQIYPIQNVTTYDQPLKGCMFRFRGIAMQYLPKQGGGTANLIPPPRDLAPASLWRRCWMGTLASVYVLSISLRPIVR